MPQSMALPGAVEIERAGLKAWPAIEAEWDGGWVRRAANGYTKRANSAQCFEPADDNNVAERVEAASRWFAARGLPPVFRVNLLTGPSLLAHLDAEGWASEGQSRLMAMVLGPVEPDPRCEVLAIDSPAFLEVQQRLRTYDDARLSRLRAVLAKLEVPACGLVVRDAEGRAVSSALMAMADGIVITGNVVTDPLERQKGYASGMMRTGLAWARSARARFAALNVEADNIAAIGLYEGLGYRRQYDYVYRVRPS